MAVSGPVPIPWPLSTSPGTNPQESQGRLINCHAEPIGEPQSGKFKWIRSPGLSLFTTTALSGFRGGLLVNNSAVTCWSGNASSIDAGGTVTNIGAFPGTKKISIARNQAAVPDVVAVDLDNGAYVLATASVVAATGTVTIGGSVFNAADVVTVVFTNGYISSFPISISHTLGAGETASTIASALNTSINANAALAAAHLTSTVVGAVITVSQLGSIANSTTILGAVTTGSETVTPSGNLSGGTGTYGVSAGSSYNGGGALPQPNSVCYQDGYFFFTIGSGQIYATGLNNLSMNSLAYITVQAKSDVTLLRGVAFSGLLLAFTTGSCEVWQDAANPPPVFPYSRTAVLEQGLVQANAIAGWETGFSELLWVAQDYGVHWMQPGSLAANKVSPPDLDRLIEAEVRKGSLLEAGCYAVAGKKFWTISSPDWTWEFNLSTRKWNERQSLTATGLLSRWRAISGFPGFGKWLVGDTQTGNFLFIDDTSLTENGSYFPQRLESLPASKFPAMQRIARADFDFVVGVGQAVGNMTVAVTGAAAGTGGVIRLTTAPESQMQTNDVVTVANVGGTTEANGTWVITVIDATHIELQRSAFVHAYTSGGTVTDLTLPANAQAPSVAISMSRDGGMTWGNPIIRQLGAQSLTKPYPISVTNMGLAGRLGARWRIDVTDPVYSSFLGATMSSELRPVGT